jgi:hypothetical protein
LKQTSQAWYTKIDHFLRQHGLTKSEANHNLYYKNSNIGVVILMLYVDDLLLTGSDATMLTKIKLQLEKQFKMSKLGWMMIYIGLEFVYVPIGIILMQRRYATMLLAQFNMMECQPTMTTTEKEIQLRRDMNLRCIDQVEY